MRDRYVLLFSAVTDWSAQQIAEALTRRGMAYRWLDPAAFPVYTDLAAVLSPQGWRGRIISTSSDETNLGEIQWADVCAVLYRRPRDFQFPDGMSDPERRFARAQARVALGGILASLPVCWINHPFALADAEYKPYQLALAGQVGLATPPTLITTNAEAVRKFADEHGTLITKPLAMPVVDEDGGQTIVATYRLGDAQLSDPAALAGVELTAHLFQPELTKDYEVRMNVIGEHVFAVAIHAHSPDARLDWRSDYDALTYTVIDPPEDVLRGARTFLQRSHLTYGAFDFAVTPTGDWVMFECNAGGQWGWLATECGLPIADAFAAELVGERNR